VIDTPKGVGYRRAEMRSRIGLSKEQWKEEERKSGKMSERLEGFLSREAMKQRRGEAEKAVDSGDKFFLRNENSACDGKRYSHHVRTSKNSGGTIFFI
jgi:hypothetical protein